MCAPNVILSHLATSVAAKVFNNFCLFVFLKLLCSINNITNMRKHQIHNVDTYLLTGET